MTYQDLEELTARCIERIRQGEYMLIEDEVRIRVGWRRFRQWTTV